MMLGRLMHTADPLVSESNSWGWNWYWYVEMVYIIKYWQNSGRTDASRRWM